jgi:LuxR family transcriptional regulator, maltose regulon positive regulatory protein
VVRVDDDDRDRLCADGDRALAEGRWSHARMSFDRALSHGVGPVGYEGLSWAAWWLEDVDECLAAREQAYRLYRHDGDARGAARMALWLSDDYMEFKGAGAVAGGWFQRAVRLLEELESCAEHGWRDVFAAHAALARGDHEVAGRLAESARTVGRRHDAVDLEMFAVATEGQVRLERGEVEAGLRCMDEAVTAALSGEYENLVPAAWSCCLMMSACEQVRDYARGIQWCARIDEFSRRLATRFVTGVCRAHYGAILAVRGEWAQSERELVEALRHLDERRPAWRAEALVRLGHLRRMQGRLSEAEELFAEEPEDPVAQCGLAAIRLEGGDPAAARDLLERALRGAPGGVGRATSLELLVRAELALGDAAAAGTHLGELRACADATGTEPLRAAVAFCAGLLAAAEGDLPRACDRFEDAVDGFTRSHAPVEGARARVELARTLRALGREDVAADEVTRAVQDLTAIGADGEAERARQLLGRVETSGDASEVLTARQVQVLRLVAEGLADNEIAERLVLSEHTVHRHVANIYTRLGCSTRAAAVAKGARLGLL